MARSPGCGCAIGEWEQVAAWRSLSDEVKLVDSTRLRRIKEGPERRAATLADGGVDAVNMHATDWTGGLTTLFHRFERLAFGWDAQFDRVLRRCWRWAATPCTATTSTGWSTRYSRRILTGARPG